MNRVVTSVLAFICFAVPCTHGADAERTVFLAASVPPAAGLNIAWHAAQQKYYAVGGGAGEPMYSRAYVFSGAGVELQAFTEIELDIRSVNYKSTTNKLEVITFNARDGGVGAVGKAYRFGLDGSYVDTWNLDIEVSQFYGGASVAKGQFFVFDPARNGWQGYAFVSSPACDDIDFNSNGVFPEDQDVVDFFNVLAGGSCP